MAAVGFLGLGTMGASMAGRLLEAGHEVTVWNRSAAAADPLVEAGARRATGPADALRAGIAFSMLSNDRAVQSVFSPEVLEQSRGATHVNMSTVSMDTARALARSHDRAGVDYVSAPVLGRPHLAQSGQLNIVAAGPSAAMDRAEPLLVQLGKRVWRVGEEPEKANLVKIGVNYNLIHAMQALAESVGLLESGDVDGRTFVEILTDAAFTGSAYGGYGPMIAQREYTPTMFSMELGLKDLGLVHTASEELGSALPTMDVLKSVFEEALEDPELADLDWSAMAEITRRRGRTTSRHE